MNLKTTYLGLKLRTPLVVSASPLSESLDSIKRLEDAGASAIVLYSLFEEQIRYERYELHRHTTEGTESYPEALSYFPDPHELSVGPEAYLHHIARAKAAVMIPIVASLNGSTPGGWTSFGKQIQQAGADALELNLYSVPTDPEIAGADLEKQFIDVLTTVKAEVTIPIAVKLSPFFTNFANMAKRFDEGGANGLVLFNRFYQPDIELESLEVAPNVMFSTPMAMRLPLRWIAILYERVSASLAATSGIHRGTNALKMLMAGADVTMLCSVLMRHGIDHLRVIEEEMVNWMREHEYESVEQLKGSLSHKNCPDPGAFERAQYMRAVGVNVLPEPADDRAFRPGHFLPACRLVDSSLPSRTGSNPVALSRSRSVVPGPAPPTPTDPQPPPTIPDYDLLRCIGSGSYGEVWLARNVLGRCRAVKIIYRSRFVDPRPFEREFEGIQRFEPISRSHPSQLAILHVGKNDAAGCFYYVMELADDADVAAGVPPAVEGGVSPPGPLPTTPSASLRRATIPLGGTPCSTAGEDARRYAPHTLRHDLERHGRLPVLDCAQIGLSLATALAHLHEQGLVHRDIKPSNIIFVNGVAKLGDIGLVTEAGDTQSIVGTEGYLPPEGPGTSQADLFSLGKVLYEAVTGLDRRQLPRLPDGLRAWPDAPQVFEFNEIVLRACAKDTAQRYETAEQLRADLLLLQGGGSLKARPRRKQFWGWTKRTAAIGAVLLALVLGGALKWRRSPTNPPLSKVPEAELLYRQALAITRVASVDRRLEAYTNLTRAVQLDPQFLDAHYALLEVYFDAYVGNKLPPYFNYVANVRAVRDKLRELNPNSAQYLTADSLVLFEDWEFEAAMREAALAIERDPYFMRGHSLFGSCLLFINGDAEGSLRELEIAERIDPADLTVQIIKSVPYMLKRDYASAIQQLQRAKRLEPRTTQVHLNLADALEANQQYDEALKEYEQFELSLGDDPVGVKEWYQKAHRLLLINNQDPRGYWEAALERDGNHARSGPYQKARLNARLGRHDEAFKLLEQCYENRDGWMPFILMDDCFDSMHRHPHFRRLIERLKLRPIPGALR